MNSLSLTVADGVATLSIRRPAVSNAIDITIIRAMHLALDQIQKGDSGARAVVITGSNEIFCSGLYPAFDRLKTQKARNAAHFEMRRNWTADPCALAVFGFRSSRRSTAPPSAPYGACAGERHHHRRRKRVFPAVFRAARLGAGRRHHLSFGAPHRRRAFIVVVDVGGKNRCQDGSRLGLGVLGGAGWRGRVARAGRGQPPPTGPCAVLGQIRSLHASTFDNSLQEQLRAERSAQEMTLETHDCVEGVRAFFEKRDPHFSEH